MVPLALGVKKHHALGQSPQVIWVIWLVPNLIPKLGGLVRSCPTWSSSWDSMHSRMMQVQKLSGDIEIQTNAASQAASDESEPNLLSNNNIFSNTISMVWRMFQCSPLIIIYWPRLLKDFKLVSEKFTTVFKELAGLKAELTMMDEGASLTDEFSRLHWSALGSAVVGHDQENDPQGSKNARDPSSWSWNCFSNS